MKKRDREHSSNGNNDRHGRRGRRRTDKVPEVSESFMSVDPANIANKLKRRQVFMIQKREKKRRKKEERVRRQKEAEALGEEVKVPVQKTLDNTREFDETVVTPEDIEVQQDEERDEFADYFDGETVPKIIITTCYHPTKVMFDFVKDLLRVFPGSYFYERRGVPLKTICTQAAERGFTDIIVLNENRKKLNGWLQMHLPKGPTAYYKLTSVLLQKDIKGHARSDLSKPEVILNNFNTRLGHRVGRMLGSLFHQEPNFRYRRVATFHNQRDFIFFRHHRYIFDRSKTKTAARLQEIGPRFTLKMKWLQNGTFDTKHGEFEWKHKTEMDTSRKRFFL